MHKVRVYFVFICHFLLLSLTLAFPKRSHRWALITAVRGNEADSQYWFEAGQRAVKILSDNGTPLDAYKCVFCLFFLKEAI
jgi:hypothetical protein